MYRTLCHTYIKQHELLPDNAHAQHSQAKGPVLRIFMDCTQFINAPLMQNQEGLQTAHGFFCWVANNLYMVMSTVHPRTHTGKQAHRHKDTPAFAHTCPSRAIVTPDGYPFKALWHLIFCRHSNDGNMQSSAFPCVVRPNTKMSSRCLLSRRHVFRS